MSLETEKPVDNLSAAETFAIELQNAMKPVESIPAPVNPEKAETAPVPEQVITNKAVEATTQEATPVVVPQPPPPDNIVPEWAKGQDLTNEDVVEAINHFAGNEAADWTRTPTDQMDKAKFEQFRKVQGQYERYRLEQRKKKQESEKVETVDYLRETLNKLESRPDIYNEIKKISKELDLENKQSETPRTPTEQADLKKLIAERAQEGDYAGVAELIESAVNKRVSESVDDVKKRTIEQIRAEEQKGQQERYYADLHQTARVLMEKEGVNYEQFTEADKEDGSSPLQRLMSMGFDPVSGRSFRSGNAEKDLRDAYSFLLSQRRGNGANRLRVSLAAQPQPKQTTGKEPSITEADMSPNVKTKDVLRRLLASTS